MFPHRQCCYAEQAKPSLCYDMFLKSYLDIAILMLARVLVLRRAETGLMERQKTAEVPEK
jgi:hypothetical protein